MDDYQPRTPALITAHLCGFLLVPLLLFPVVVVSVLPASTDFLLQTSESLVIAVYTAGITALAFAVAGRVFLISLKTGTLPSAFAKGLTVLLSAAVVVSLTLGGFTKKPFDQATLASDFNQEYCLKQAVDACSNGETTSLLTLTNLFNSEAPVPFPPSFGAKLTKSRLDFVDRQAASTRAKAASACRIIQANRLSQMSTWMKALYPSSGAIDRWCGSYLHVNHYQFADENESEGTKPKDPPTSSSPGAQSPFDHHGDKLIESIQTVRIGREIVRLLYFLLYILQLSLF